jgi:uncharacterized protein YndB with AHSA1/START domain
MARSDAGGVRDLLSVRQIRTIGAPPQRVFSALTDPKLLPLWWGPKGFECRWAELDVRAGGRFRIDMLRPDTGYEGVFEGRYLEVDPPRRLVMEILEHCNGAPEVFDASALGPTQVTFTLDPRADGGTELTLLHTGFENDAAVGAHESGWAGSLGKLCVAIEHASDIHAP